MAGGSPQFTLHSVRVLPKSLNLHFEAGTLTICITGVAKVICVMAVP
jgi:hypothetical protein